MAGKYVFLDIDGTIYDYVNGVSPSAKEAVRLLKQNGHHPVLATGRTRIMIFQEILDMGFDGMVAGAGTYIEWEGQVLQNEELPQSEIARLVRCFSENGFASYPEGTDYLYFDKDYVENGDDAIYKIYQMHIPDRLCPIDLNSEIHAAKISASYTKRSDPQGVIAQVGADYDWADHSGVLFETVPRNFSKGKGIRRLMDHLGASLDDTFAFGDSYNDLEMLRTVKYGVLMGNAEDSLKEKVSIHTEGLLEDGVYNALKRFGLI